MYKVYLGLGSNVGDRLEYLSKGVEEVGSISTVTALSSIYETEPVDMDTQDIFYNMAAEVETSFDPPLLLVKLKKIERKLGRKMSSHLQSRQIDIDILLYRGLAYEDHTVQVPHPKLPYRRFVLEPLKEIAPTAVHPLLGKTIASLLRQCRDSKKVTKTPHVLSTIHSY